VGEGGPGGGGPASVVGSTDNAPLSGAVNTGSGGGAGKGPGVAGNGGSGIVIVRYLTAG